ncbi:HK97 family phage prohead protease [Methylobacterium organophilum]|jgi:HK97 family phage prohead protease|uniref:HK97 family phage prohead protease n=1 Tax=Methylobacterium organophilum TaxID=410 RepID=UPI0019D2C160|nr:HK97 family phage prohead protease [Methylobacterium organophilum]MBN6823996.1 HK97 family phage prohead protease [Methylobacterium organophilum]
MAEQHTRRRAARLRAASFDADAYTIEVVWTTGARAPMYDAWTGEGFLEELSLKTGHVRLERLNAGAPFIDAHDSTECARVVGSVVRGTARCEGGKGICTVQLSRARDVADIVTKIREGVIRNVSVGYWVHRHEDLPDDGDQQVKLAVDWEPLEISAVPVPADAGAQIRSARGGGRRAAPKPASDFEQGQAMASRLLNKPIPKRAVSSQERALAHMQGLRGSTPASERRVARDAKAREAADREAGAKAARRTLRKGFLLGR